jgi:hypothetical protein
VTPVNNTQADRPPTSRPGRANQRSQSRCRPAQRWKSEGRGGQLR